MKSIGTITIGVVALTAALVGWAVVANTYQEDPMQDKNNLKRGSKLPVVWVFLNNSDPVFAEIVLEL